jgi:hypothetical protein
VNRLGALEPGMRERGRFGARNRISSPLGSISVIRAGNHQGRVVGAYGLR